MSAAVVSGPPGQPALTTFYGPCDDPVSTYFGETCGGVPGCMDETACNFNPAATEDDGTCEYPSDECHDCEENCICEVDCNGGNPREM